jgi:hypothetical protein
MTVSINTKAADVFRKLKKTISDTEIPVMFPEVVFGRSNDNDPVYFNSITVSDNYTIGDNEDYYFAMLHIDTFFKDYDGDLDRLIAYIEANLDVDNEDEIIGYIKYDTGQLPTILYKYADAAHNMHIKKIDKVDFTSLIK